MRSALCDYLRSLALKGQPRGTIGRAGTVSTTVPTGDQQYQAMRANISSATQWQLYMRVKLAIASHKTRR